MYKKEEYKYFIELLYLVLELDDFNRHMDYETLERLPIINNERLLEFASTNSIEGDVATLSEAKLFLKREDEDISKSDLEKRWIGIKRASDLVWSNRYELSNEFIKEVHRALMRDSEIKGGVWKTKINQVGSLVTAHPEDVDKLMFQNMSNFMAAFWKEGMNVFNIIPFISEFLAIHPFEDGNGRVSRLLMNRMLYDAGYKFAKYVSISKIIWERKDEYIKALESRNRAWASNSLKPSDLIPLMKFMLECLIEAAKHAYELTLRVKYSKESLWENLSTWNEFDLSDIRSRLKFANSDSSIKKWLQEFCEEYKLVKIGDKKAARYIKKENKL